MLTIENSIQFIEMLNMSFVFERGVSPIPKYGLLRQSNHKTKAIALEKYTCSL